MAVFTLICAIGAGLIFALGDSKAGFPSIFAAIAYCIMLMVTLFTRAYQNPERPANIPWKQLSYITFYGFIGFLIVGFGFSLLHK